MEDDYPKGPGFVKGCAASRDGAIAAAPAKATQEAVLLKLVTAAGPDGITYQEAAGVVDEDIRPDVIRARLSCMKNAGKVVKLPVRRMGGYKVSVSAYALPQYAPAVDDPQSGLAVG